MSIRIEVPENSVSEQNELPQLTFLKKTENKELIDGLVVKLKVHERSIHEVNKSTHTDDNELNDPSLLKQAR